MRRLRHLLGPRLLAVSAALAALVGCADLNWSATGQRWLTSVCRDEARANARARPAPVVSTTSGGIGTDRC